MREFGANPYGLPDSPELRAEKEARRAELRAKIDRELEEILLSRQERAAERRRRAEIDEILPSRRSMQLSRTLKVPEMLRSRLERRVRRGELHARHACHSVPDHAPGDGRRERGRQDRRQPGSP